jgi:hypothetical protein
MKRENTHQTFWSNLSTAEQIGIAVGAGAQIALAATAWIDLARRPREQVRGSKSTWAALIAVNFIGPISYLTIGRKRGIPLAHSNKS